MKYKILCEYYIQDFQVIYNTKQRTSKIRYHIHIEGAQSTI